MNPTAPPNAPLDLPRPSDPLYARWEAVVGPDPRRSERIARFLAGRRFGFSAASVRAERTFVPREGDVFVATASKSGTSLLQQVVHQLRTAGDERFDEIDVTVPWMMIAKDVGVDLDGDQRELGAPPRAFKTHLGWPDAPRLVDGRLPGRYLYGVRDPLNALVSYYSYLTNRTFNEGDLSLVEFAEQQLFHDTDWATHVRGWFEAARTHRDRILWIFFEDLVAHRAHFVSRIADFIGMDAHPDRDARVAVAVERSSFAYMQAHQHRFDGHRTPAAPGVRAAPKISKINPRGPGLGHERLPEAVERVAREILYTRLGDSLGVTSYEELRARAAAEVQLCR